MLPALRFDLKRWRISDVPIYALLRRLRVLAHIQIVPEVLIVGLDLWASLHKTRLNHGHGPSQTQTCTHTDIHSHVTPMGAYHPIVVMSEPGKVEIRTVRRSPLARGGRTQRKKVRRQQRESKAP